MKPEWNAFLESAGAEWAADGSVGHFGNANRELQISTTGDVFCDLSHLGLISAHGDDTRSFLQGQLTNDTQAIDEKHSHLTAYCNPKGRMLALMRLFQRENTFYLSLPRDVLEDTLKRLRMFVLRAQVTMEDASDALVRIGVSGPNAEKRIHEAVGPIPSEPNQVSQVKGITVVRLPGFNKIDRFEIHGELDAMQQVWNDLNVDAAPVGADVWKLLEVMALQPTVYQATKEAFVPQMANLERVNGVSFTKGCYTGQEIVARMQYLGQLKRRMYPAYVKTASGQSIQPGDKLFVAGKEQATGEVVEAAPHPDDGYALSGVMRIAAYEEGDVRLGAPDGPALQFLDLPYTLAD